DPSRSPLCSTGERQRLPCRLRAGRIVHRAVRREFQLARADLVPRQLSADRIVAEIPSLSRRRLPGRVPHRFRPDDDIVGGRGRTLAPYDADLPEGTRRTTASTRYERHLSRRSELAGLDPLLRVLPWR